MLKRLTNPTRFSDFESAQYTSVSCLRRNNRFGAGLRSLGFSI
jgi:hypothetical protein